jgi:hypothetical protein
MCILWANQYGFRLYRNIMPARSAFINVRDETERFSYGLFENEFYLTYVDALFTCQLTISLLENTSDLHKLFIFTNYVSFASYSTNQSDKITEYKYVIKELSSIFPNEHFNDLTGLVNFEMLFRRLHAVFKKHKTNYQTSNLSNIVIGNLEFLVG